jgi:hypothetical protein
VLEVGGLECWSIGVLGYWGVGVLGCWGVGVLGCWGVGVLGCWGVGVTIQSIVTGSGNNDTGLFETNMRVSVSCPLKVPAPSAIGALSSRRNLSHLTAIRLRNYGCHPACSLRENSEQMEQKARKQAAAV